MAYTAQDWTVSALAVELGIDRRTIGKKVSDIEPTRIKGTYKYYRMSEVARVVFGEGGSGDLNAERTRLAKAQADKTELEVKQLTGELIPAGIISDEWGDIASTIRSKLLSLPIKIARVAIAAETLKEVEEVTRSEINLVLTELSRNADIESDQGGDMEHTKTAPALNS